MQDCATDCGQDSLFFSQRMDDLQSETFLALIPTDLHPKDVCHHLDRHGYAMKGGFQSSEPTTLYQMQGLPPFEGTDCKGSSDMDLCVIEKSGSNERSGTETDCLHFIPSARW